MQTRCGGGEPDAQICVRPAAKVPICLDRHNSATANQRLAKIARVDQKAREEPLAERIRLWKNSVRELAEGLGRGWRFFPTYAQIQTGSVLSSHFLQRVIRE